MPEDTAVHWVLKHEFQGTTGVYLDVGRGVSLVVMPPSLLFRAMFCWVDSCRCLLVGVMHQGLAGLVIKSGSVRLHERGASEALQLCCESRRSRVSC
jgi:hypothetical protein